MLQKLNFEDELHQPSQSHLLRPSYYWEIVKRRWLHFLVPFVFVLSAGGTGLYYWPVSYLSEGKILVQSQLIPTELVRPTVTSAAQERIQVIQQRIMTRDNLLAIASKFQLYPAKRSSMSVTDLVELMKKNTTIEPVEQDLSFSKQPVRGEVPTIVFTVGFSYSDPEGATRVANELVTRILAEDLRDRTSRATDTTKFLAREVQRLQADNAALDSKILQAKIAQGKPTTPTAANSPDQAALQLSQLKSEYVQKGALYSERHPIMQALKRQIEAMEKAISQPPVVQVAGSDAPAPDIEALETQQTALQKDLDTASSKLAAARLGETLERDQQSERLEVIEQPTLPQQPDKPNRPKVALVMIALALMAGVGAAFASEMMDSGIRRSSDIMAIVNGQLILAIPYITTKAEVRRRRLRSIAGIIVSLVVLSGLATAAYYFLPPLDQIVAKLRTSTGRTTPTR